MSLLLRSVLPFDWSSPMPSHSPRPTGCSFAKTDGFQMVSTMNGFQQSLKIIRFILLLKAEKSFHWTLCDPNIVRCVSAWSPRSSAVPAPAAPRCCAPRARPRTGTRRPRRSWGMSHWRRPKALASRLVVGKWKASFFLFQILKTWTWRVQTFV